MWGRWLQREKHAWSRWSSVLWEESSRLWQHFHPIACLAVGVTLASRGGEAMLWAEQTAQWSRDERAGTFSARGILSARLPTAKGMCRQRWVRWFEPWLEGQVFLLCLADSKGSLSVWSQPILNITFNLSSFYRWGNKGQEVIKDSPELTVHHEAESISCKTTTINQVTWYWI